MLGEININIEFGNLWEVLTAIGTIGAVVVSLYFSLKSNKKEISVILGKDIRFQDEYQLTLSKNPIDMFLLTEVWIIQNFKKKKLSVKEMDILNSKEVSVDYSLPYLFSDLNIIILSFYNNNLDEYIGKKVKFLVIDSNGNKFYSNKLKLE
ncbi:hypothetical protein [Carnobacterium maltaromaticum]|uniref:hypothetical protein n=1 Tax=Carnobacterium maltaromaticum TaxID=2751 RepID=UPI0039B0D588